MRIAITSNGPGEFSGWVRPLVSTLYQLAPDTDVTLFFVPDDYATGREAGVARAMFPQASVVEPGRYVRFALGGALSDGPERVDVVQYLGGDLSHAARVRARLGGEARTYKFARKRDRCALARAYAIDDANAQSLERTGVPRTRIATVGNLAIDGALGEAAGAYASANDSPLPPDTILLLPGTRKGEFPNVLPLFLQAAIHLQRLRPELSVAFALSPFTTDGELARVLNYGGHRSAWGARGRVVAREGGGIAVRADEGGLTVPVVRDAMRHAPRARFAVSLPGTKCIELAALGVPTLVCVPLNAPEVVVVNGPLQYLDRLPIAGTLLKRALVVAVDRRFALTAQPNIDAGEILMPEMRGTLFPGDVARRIAAYADDVAGRAMAASRLRDLYANHRGAAERMARSLLEVHAS